MRSSDISLKPFSDSQAQIRNRGHGLGYDSKYHVCHSGVKLHTVLPRRASSIRLRARDLRMNEYSRANELITPQEEFTVSGLDLKGYFISVPLDYSNPEGPKIDVYFRVARSTSVSKNDKLPYLLYLQGGPGFEAPRPSSSHGWMNKAIQYFSVVLLDQRGTGRSTPVTISTLKKFSSGKEQAEYLQHFRADSIVKDAERIREVWANGCRWSLLGQSFGGFCAVQYLSSYPQGLAEVLLTGGIPPKIQDSCAAKTAYKRLYRRVITQNRKFYTRFPGDVAQVQKLVKYLKELPEGARLPDGSLLSVRGLQTLGLSCLGFAEGFERLHYLLEEAFDSEGKFNPIFLSRVMGFLPWDTNPLYAVLHESIYCQGQASNWAAESIRKELFEKDFDAINAEEEGREVLFTGEMIFPWMFDDFAALRPFKESAQILSEKFDWPVLYNLENLKANRVPAAAMCYYEDMYVDFHLAEETSQKIGNLRCLITNEHMHSGIRENGEVILEKLLGITRNSRVLF